MALTFTLTTAGRTALVNAANTGTNAVLIASAGLSAANIVPGPAMTALAGEYKRITTLSGDTVADDTIHIIVRDESADTYTVRAIGLYLDDGTLFGLYGQAAPVLEKTAQSLLLLGVDVKFADIDASAITFGDTNFLNPPATTERQGVIELATPSETAAGTDYQRAVTPYTLKISYADVWRASNDGAGSGLDADLLRGYAPSINSLPSTIAQRTWEGYLYSVYYRQDSPNNENSPVSQVITTNGADGYFRKVSFANFLGQGAVWTANNDGSGSALDADLLDGRHGYEYVQRGVGNRPFDVDYNGGYALIQGDAGGWEGGYFFRDYLANKWGGFGVYGGGQTRHYFFVGPNYQSQATLRVYPDRVQWGDNPIWHSANDGAGSGLDADLLDGRQGAEYALISGADFSGPVSSTSGIMAGPDGFRQSLYVPNARNPIWRFGNADGYGLSYFQGAAGYAGGDSIGIHFGNPTLAGSILAVHSSSGATLQGSFTATGGGSFAAQITRAGNPVWDAGNDGSGSGVDADLLDGHHASAFGRLGANAQFSDLAADRGNGTGVIYLGPQAGTRYLYFDGSNYVLGGVSGLVVGGGFTWTAANDGSGSGLDADLLDGLDSSYFGNIPARLGYTPVQQGTGVGQLANSVKLGWSGARLKATVDATDQGNIVFDGHISDVWRASNDGSGSGMDTDLWRGLTPAQFIATMFSSGQDATTGVYWRKFPDGNGGQMIRMSGITDNFYTETSQVRAYPFTLTEVTDAGATMVVGAAGPNWDNIAQIIGTPGLTSITIMNQESDGRYTYPIKARWFVEGKL